MAMVPKVLHRKPPDGILEISERVFVFDSCFTSDIVEEDELKVYMRRIINTLHEYYPDASFMVFNFREGESQSNIGNILSEYDLTVMDYPLQYEGCPLLTIETINHFLKSSESWLSLGEQNVLLLHCETGGWPVLAFSLAALLIYRKQNTGEHKTLDMIYKQAPRELLQLISPLNPLPSQLRYLQYVSRRNVGSVWPPLDRALTLDCVILRVLPNIDGEGGCRPIFRIYGQDPFMAADRTPKVLFSTPKRTKIVRYYKQADCELAKIDIHCHIQGDVVLECISLDNDLEREEMMFRVMFNTAFVKSNILSLNRDEIDVPWNGKDNFPEDFRAEVLFSDMDSASSLITIDLPGFEEKGLPIEAFAKVQEIFSSVGWLDPKADAALNMLHQITASNYLHERLDGSPRSLAKEKLGSRSPRSERKENSESVPSFFDRKGSPQFDKNGSSSENLTRSDNPLSSFSHVEESSQPPFKSLESQVVQRPATLSKIVSQRNPDSISSPGSGSKSVQGSPATISRYSNAHSLGISALLHDHSESAKKETSPVSSGSATSPHVYNKPVTQVNVSFPSSPQPSLERPDLHQNSSASAIPPPVPPASDSSSILPKDSPETSVQDRRQLSPDNNTQNDQTISSSGLSSVKDSSETLPGDRQQVPSIPLAENDRTTLTSGSSSILQSVRERRQLALANHMQNDNNQLASGSSSVRSSSETSVRERRPLSSAHHTQNDLSVSTSGSSSVLQSVRDRRQLSSAHQTQNDHNVSAAGLSSVLQSVKERRQLASVHHTPNDHNVSASGSSSVLQSVKDRRQLSSVNNTQNEQNQSASGSSSVLQSVKERRQLASVNHTKPLSQTPANRNSSSSPEQPSATSSLRSAPSSDSNIKILSSVPTLPPPSSTGVVLSPPHPPPSPSPPPQPPQSSPSLTPPPPHMAQTSSLSVSQNTGKVASSTPQLAPPQPPPPPPPSHNSQISSPPPPPAPPPPTPVSVEPSMVPPPPAPVSAEPSMAPPPPPAPVSAKPSMAPPPPPPPLTSQSASAPPPPLASGSASAPPPPPPPLASGSGSAPPPPPPPLASRSGSAPPPPPPPLASGSASAPPPPPPPLGAKNTGPGPPAPPPPAGGRPGAPPPPGPPPPPGGGRPGAPPPPGPPPPPGGGRPGAPPPPGPPPPGGNGPPPPPFGAKGKLPSRTPSRSQGPVKKNNLKPYHWLKLTRAMQGSLWDETQKTNNANAPEFDMSELEHLFSANPITDSKAKEKRAAGPKIEKVQLIELRRAYNCEIMLTKVKVPLPDLMSSVLALDDSALDIDQVDNLIKFCPTKEEMEMLKNYQGDKDMLGKCEQFFLELMKVPRVESKLRVFSFKIQFRAQVSELRNNLNIVNAACQEVRNSLKLKRIMQTILSLGNALNYGTARGSAVGFRLDSLLKLTDTRANNKLTLMHYLCKVIAEKLPELLDVHKDLMHLEVSTKIQLKFLAEEMQALSKGLEKVVQELNASEKDGAVSQIFCKTLKGFLGHAESEVRSLASLYSGVGRQADALAMYFGEDPAKCPFEQVVNTLLNFVRMFMKAHDENLKQKELEKKKAEKEAAEKAKMNAAATKAQDQSNQLIQTQ